MLDIDMSVIWMSIIFGSIGAGLFIYGKKQQRMPHLIAGIALSVLPYFITNVIAMTIIGVVLTIAPFFMP